MPIAMPFPVEDLFELRLFLEELVCNICRFVHAAELGISPQAVRIRQEVSLGTPHAFADILIQVPQHASYFVEVDYGYSPERILESIRRKYSKPLPFFEDIAKLILVVDRHHHPDWELCAKHVKDMLPSSWALEVWDEPHLLSLIRAYFDVEIAALSPDQILEVRLAIDRAKGTYAFGAMYNNDPLDASLLWHFGYWRLHDLFEAMNRSKRSILPPASYPAVVVIFADLSGFSGYVRETPRTRTIQNCLGAFCAKARYQIINEGGMLCQFLGDGVIGLFGIPTHSLDYIERSFACARSLLTLADAISNEWQRQLDRLQPVRGCHIGMAMGDLQILSLRPFSRTHIGVIGDAINMAARLSAHAQPGQVVVSNIVYQSLDPASQSQFHETEPIEAKNVGRIQAWTFDQTDYGVASAV
jgi:class 3 adenylate cyclase